MPRIKQIVANNDNPVLTPLEQIVASAATAGSMLVEISANAFIWGRATPYGDPGDYWVKEKSIVFEGVGFIYDGGDLPASGILTSITISGTGLISDDNVIVPYPKLEFTGLAIDLSEMGDELLAALTGDIAPLYNYFLDLQWAYEGNDSPFNREDRFEGSNLDDIINGNGGDDWLYGLGGNDVLRLTNGRYNGHLFGGDGDDVLIVKGGDVNMLNGGPGADILIGGTSGIDYADYSDASSRVSVNLANPSLNSGDAAGDIFQSIEIIVGSAFDDFFQGDEQANEFVGGGGNDAFIGGAGGDTFIGDGQYSNQLIGFDIVSYSTATSGVIANLANPENNTGDARNDFYRSIEGLQGSYFSDELYGTNTANTIWGFDGDDIIKGYGGDDIMEGGKGNDRIDGGTEADTMTGGSGDDVYVVDNTGDKVTELASEGTDSIEASISYSLAGNHVENVYLTGSIAINGTGNSLDNVVKGNAGRNSLNGSGGSDKINGAGGADLLTGGTGPDQFIYSKLSDSTVDAAGRDTILDFAKGQDRINLSPIDANTKISGDQAFTFIGGAAYSNKAGELRYGVSGGQTVISGDVNGDGVTDFKIVLSGIIALGSADFVL
ncbi:calcium-binding protein [Rhizobium sp. Leaf453]|uniref:calcium-binding protein n=1 Tax=Rhizobium sp. Leaf453 TaxID=1736380 RepID=UPI000AF96917|nr:calcium-binding protein [Rhizobium sp. Leaf453]